MGLRETDIRLARLHYDELLRRAARERLVRRAARINWNGYAKRGANHLLPQLRALFSNWAAWLRIRTNPFSSTYPATFITFPATMEREHEQLCCPA